MSRRMYIPKLGDCVELAENWRFILHTEHRNMSLWKVLGVEPPSQWRWFHSKEQMENDAGYQACLADPEVELTVEEIKYYGDKNRFKVQAVKPVTLPKGTVLRIDRIYIRKGSENYDSVTFVIEKSPLVKGRKKPRFWVKLDDANKMVLEDNNVTVKVVKPVRPASYRVTALSYHPSHIKGLDMKWPSLQTHIRTSKMGDGVFLDKMVKEYGPGNIEKIEKSPDGRTGWGTKWEVLVQHPGVKSKVDREMRAAKKAEQAFFKAEREKIEEKYGDILSHVQGPRIAYGHMTLEQFEDLYINSPHYRNMFPLQVLKVMVKRP